MKLLDFLDRVRHKHEPENAGLLSEDEYECLDEDDTETYHRLLHEEEGAVASDGMLSDETYDILGADDWEEHGGDPRGDNLD